MEDGHVPAAAPQPGGDVPAQSAGSHGPWCAGLMVQVLHEDGKWYDGQLTEFSEETSKWHILFDDGDRDWYSLPDRDVRVVREQQSRQWTSFLLRHRIGDSTSKAKENCRDAFTREFKVGARIRPHRKTPGQAVGAPAPNTEGGMERWKPLDSSSFLGATEDGRDGPGLEGRRFSKRPRFSGELHEKLRTMPEARLYMQLVELENKIDAVTSRKRLEFAEELKAPRLSTRVLQLFVWNTHENQGGSGAAWVLHIGGRYADSEGGSGGKDVPFTDLMDRVFIQLPPEDFKEGHSVHWVRGKKEEAKGRESFDSFELRREGSKECKIRIQLHPAFNPARYSLKGKPELAKLLGWERGTWNSLLLAFWAYVRDEGLQDEANSLFIKLDGKMQEIFEESRIPLTQVGERLWEFVSEVDAIEVEYTLCLSGEAKPAVFEVLLEAEDAVVAKMRAFMDESGIRDEALACESVDQEISELVAEIEVRRRKRDFMKNFAETPIRFMHELTCAMALDLRTIKSYGPYQYSHFNTEDVLRAQLWQQPWTEEAVLHYLNMQGYDVNLNLENTLGEEDAVAFALSAIAASATAQAVESGTISQTSEASHRQQILQRALPPSTNPPPVQQKEYYSQRPQMPLQAPGRLSTLLPPQNLEDQGDGDFFCEPCKRYFKSHHALCVHNATSQYHKQDKKLPSFNQGMGGWPAGGAAPGFWGQGPKK